MTGVQGPLVVALFLAISLLVLRRKYSWTSLSVLVLAYAMMPELSGVPTSLIIAGRELFFVDIALPVAALGAWYVAAQRAVRSAPAAYLSTIAVLATTLGLAGSAPSFVVLRDLRPIVLSLCAFMIVRSAVIAGSSKLLLACVQSLLWLSAGLVLLESSAGLRLLGGRVEDVARVENRVSSSGIDATRFLISTTNGALLVLCCTLALAMQRWRPTFGWLGFVVRFTIPSSVLVLLSFSRRAAIALGVCVVLSLIIGRNIKRAAAVVAWGLIAAAMIALCAPLIPPALRAFGTDQWQAFSARVVTGLSGTSRARDLGVAWRSIENVFAWRAFWESPVFGHGLGHLYRPSVGGEPFAVETRLYGRAYIHNYYLWWLVKTGVAGLALFALGFLAPVRREIVRILKNNRNPTLESGLAIGLSGLLAVGVVAPIFNEIAGAVLLGAVVGWIDIRTAPPIVKESPAVSGVAVRPRSRARHRSYVS